MDYRTARVGRARRRVFEEVAALDDKCFPEDIALTWESFKAGAWWLVRYKGELVGYASAVYADGVVILTRAGVDPDHRGKNLQRRLIEHRIRWAQKQRASTVITYTTTENPASANNLIAAGFRIFCPETWPTGEATDSAFVRWRLRLREAPPGAGDCA